MKHMFRSHFISMNKEITILELSQIKQRHDEKIEDYMIRFRNNYVRLTREMHVEDAIQMCIHGMQQHWLVPVSRRDPKIFNALGDAISATKLEFEKAPHIMEMYKNAGNNDNNRRFNTPSKPMNNEGKPRPAESNTTNTVPVFGPRNDQRPNRRSNIRELLNKQYVFRKDLVKSLFEQMNEQHLLTLPNPTRPEQVDMVDNPPYCPYHRYVGHKIEDCIAFKEWLQRAVDEGKLALKPEAINPNYQATNVVTISHGDETSGARSKEERWVPLMEVERQLHSYGREFVKSTLQRLTIMVLTHKQLPPHFIRDQTQVEGGCHPGLSLGLREMNHFPEEYAHLPLWASFSQDTGDNTLRCKLLSKTTPQSEILPHAWGSQQ
jgi:hypothetical protein